MSKRKVREIRGPRFVIREAGCLVTMESLEAGNEYLRTLGIIQENERIHRIEVAPEGGGCEKVMGLKIVNV